MADTLGSFSAILKEVSEKKQPIINKKIISLENKEYFELFIGKRITKTELRNIKGDIPIYSANVFNPIGYHYLSNIEHFDYDCVLWGIDGDFEFNAIEKHIPFVSTDHCGTIRILHNDILAEYLMIELDRCKHIYGFDRGLRSSLKNMKQVKVEIPIRQCGAFDIDAQQSIIEKYNVVNDLKSKVKEYEQTLKELTIKA